MTTPNHALNAPADGGQLELFPTGEGDANSGITRAVAMASISPGWRSIIATLFDRPGQAVVVHTCREINGVLLLDATIADVDMDVTRGLLEQLRAAASQTCGCCGSTPARPYRARPEDAIYVVCESCRMRLQAGDSFQRVADAFFMPDGSRRWHLRVPLVMLPSSASTPSGTTKRQCERLQPKELRQVISEIRESMSAKIIGQESAVARLSLLAGLHVGAGLPRGGRALIVGHSGVGKTALIEALRQALAHWDVAWVATDAIDLTSPGWSGAPTIGDLIDAALGGIQPDAPSARHAIVVIDEIHHIGVVHDTTGNMEAKRREVLASLLGIAGHGSVHLGDGTGTWSSQEALVIAAGAFTDLLDLSRPLSVRDIVRAGLPLELATRLAEEIIVLRRLPERTLIDLLRNWPALKALCDVCNRLGYSVRIADEAYARAARVLALGYDDSTPRTAGGWLVSALRHALIAALADPGVKELVITPDSLPIPRTATSAPPPDDPPEAHGPGDSTIFIAPP